MKLISNKEIDRKKWDARVAASEIENIFSYAWYLDATSPNWKAVISEDYQTLFPFGFEQKLNFKQVFQPIFTREFDIIGNDFDHDELLGFLSNHFNYVRLRNVNFKNGIQRVHQVLDLTKELEFRTNAKRLIKKGQKQFILETAFNPETIIKIFKETTLSKIDTLKDSDLISLQQLMSNAINEKKGQLIHILEGGKIVGGAFFLIDKKRITLLKSACTQEAKRSGAMYFLIGNKIEESKESFKTFDFGGSNEPNVKEFYCKFGAKDRAYFEIEMGEKPLWLKAVKSIIG